MYGSRTLLLGCFAFTLRVDYDSGLYSIAKVDPALEPIVNHVWRGKILLFPILLDRTFQFWE
jgi:hypothetical protein